MTSNLPIVRLSQQAGRILPHLNWLPNEVIDIINRFPYHSARLFAAGMDYFLNKSEYHTRFESNDPIHFISSSSYGYTLNIGEFVSFISIGTTGLLLNIGSIAGQALVDNLDLKKVLVPSNQSIQSAIQQYNVLKNEMPDLRKKEYLSYFTEPSIGKRIELLVQAIDAGASNLAGLKECYLVANYYERAYNRVNNSDSHKLDRIIDALNYELPPFPDTVETRRGDKLLFDKPGVTYERHWPDVLLRDGKYSIVHHMSELGSHMIATPNTSNYDDIRMAESRFGEMACFILCKRGGKWGAIYSNGLQYFFILIVPYIYDTPEEVASVINEFIEWENDAKWVTWSDFKGLFNYHD